MRNCLLATALFLLCACGSRGGKDVSKAPAARNFPQVEVPMMVDNPEESASYVVSHFWDRFTDTSQVYACDSTLVNGVTLENVESQVGMYITLLEQRPLPEAVRAVERFYDRLDAFERKYPESNVYEELTRLTSRYLYDPNSPVRSEDLYLPFVERLATSDLVADGLKPGFGWDAQKCRLNRVGTPATDFSFTDTRGRVRTLYGIQAEYVLLIFANPGCNACQEITAEMKASPEISDLISSGRLKVVAVYIDQEIDDWKAHIADYPTDWINGYDHNYAIRTDVLYNVRAIPSIYLLDAAKTVLMKDAPQERALTALANIHG